MISIRYKNEFYIGYRTTPSCVSYAEGQVLVGKAAIRKIPLNPEQTIYGKISQLYQVHCEQFLDAKRMIGRRYYDKLVEKYANYWGFNVVEGPYSQPLVAIPLNGSRITMQPWQISQKVLEKMKETVERKFQTPIKDVVITVPAYFNQAQKSATIEAAKAACLNVLELITEPAAAAYAYGFGKDTTNEMNLLIVDLGGGTFDVVIIKVKNGCFKVIAIGGDTQLGGRDFDHMLMDYFSKLIQEKYGKDCLTRNLTRYQFSKECMRIKHDISIAAAKQQ